MIKKYLKQGKKVCIVSPELHKREYLTLWDSLRPLSKQKEYNNLLLCTDHPDQAKKYFNL